MKRKAMNFRYGELVNNCDENMVDLITWAVKESIFDQKIHNYDKDLDIKSFKKKLSGKLFKILDRKRKGLESEADKKEIAEAKLMMDLEKRSKECIHDMFKRHKVKKLLSFTITFKEEEYFAHIISFLAWKYANKNMELYEDLVCMGGWISLDQAIKNFDPEMGYHFAQYAFYWIRTGIIKLSKIKKNDLDPLSS